MGGFVKNKLAAKRGYTYRLTRRQLLVASSAAALAACAPGAVTPSASSSVAPGKALTRDTTNCAPSCKSPYIFRASFSSYQISYPIGDYLSAKGTKEFFLAYANYGFGTESAADFTTGLKKNGGATTGNVAPPLGNPDFAPFV